MNREFGYVDGEIPFFGFLGFVFEDFIRSTFDLIAEFAVLGAGGSFQVFEVDLKFLAIARRVSFEIQSERHGLESNQFELVERCRSVIGIVRVGFLLEFLKVAEPITISVLFLDVHIGVVKAIG